MNIVKDLVARVEKRLTQTKSPCKLYLTEEKAEAAAIAAAKFMGEYFAKDPSKARPARYIVVFISSIGKWTCGFDQTEVMQRHDSTGGYLGIMADQKFYTF